jgi:methylamine---glutamate N-methyltransferase subunit B
MNSPVSQNPTVLDATRLSVDEIHQQLANVERSSNAFEIRNCQDQDWLGTGVASNVPWSFQGRLGDYCFGAAANLECKVDGEVGHGFAEMMQSGIIEVRGNAGDALMGFGKSGLIVVHGNTGRRAGVGLDGGELIVKGSVGSQAGFEMQSGTIIIFGSAGSMLGLDARGGTIYVGGEVESTSANLEEDRIREADRLRLSLLLLKAGIETKPASWKVFRVVTTTSKH